LCKHTTEKKAELLTGGLNPTLTFALGTPVVQSPWHFKIF